jgi:CRISPR/Cas system CSM-associated protein Csm3 (group 7 of RAMP superfamily)
MTNAEHILPPHWTKGGRRITKRIVLEGTLELVTPASFGNGDADGLTDMPLALDPLQECALLTGASIAGALRCYLRESIDGYEAARDQGEIKLARALFGSLADDDEQSALIVDDALGTEKPVAEVRDGVRIAADTRTAFIDPKGKGAKFDIELLPAGTQFNLRFELLLSEFHDDAQRADLLRGLAVALRGLESGAIHLGRRKRRGYGQCRVTQWQASYYNLLQYNGLLTWLSADLGQPATKTVICESKEISDRNFIAEVLSGVCGITQADLQAEDKREHFTLKAAFALDGALLIRSGSVLRDAAGAPLPAQPDAVHLHSRRGNKSVPVLPGTSLAGVLRHRALRIAQTLTPNGRAKELVDSIFGADMEELKKQKKQPWASRLEVKEAVIEKTQPLVQTRVKIDRFTGGAYDTALFDEAPVFNPTGGKGVTLELKLRAAREKAAPLEAEIGLLLLLLKDLWTADLPIGGASSVGRGRLRGDSAELNYHNGANGWTATLKANPASKAIALSGKTHAELNQFVTALKDYLDPKGGTTDEQPQN